METKPTRGRRKTGRLIQRTIFVKAHIDKMLDVNGPDWLRGLLEAAYERELRQVAQEAKDSATQVRINDF